MLRSHSLLALAGVCLGIGCAQILGFERGTPESGGAAPVGGTAGTAATGGSAGSGGEAGSVPSGCPQGFDCVPTSDAAQIVRALQTEAGCPADWGEELALYDGVDPGCTSCTCGVPSGGHCELTVKAFDSELNDPNCSSALHTTTSADGACVNVSGEAWGVSGGSPVDGSCPEDGGERKPISSLRVCRLTAGAPDPCGAGHLCAPTADPPLGTACVLIPSANAVCPDGYAAVDGASYQEATDGRTCSCSCGPVSGAGCTNVGGIDIYSATNCQTKIRNVPASDGCAQLNTAGTKSYKVKAGTWGAATCTPSAGPPGQVSFASEATLCCPA